MEIVTLKLDEFVEYKGNPRKNDHAVEKMAQSIKEFGFRVPVLVKQDKTVIDGHLRLKAARAAGLKEIPAVYVDDLTDAQIKAFRIAINRMAELADWDEELLGVELQELREMDFDLDLTGFDTSDIDDFIEKATGEAAEDKRAEAEASLLRDTFIEPPFSVLDTKTGSWQARKQKWIDLGIESDIGRDAEVYDISKKMEKNENRISVFDPALAEVLYHWFCTPGGAILDPFAGGSVRGIVANFMGFKYTGIDIRQEQIDSNLLQAKKILPGREPVWVVGDSNAVLEDMNESYDLVFSCPPYADLEVYSDLPGDISNKPYDEFITLYESIIDKSCKLLKRGGFACFVVSEVRDKKGHYRGFVPATIKAFEQAGMKFYNEAILLNCIVSAAFRAAGHMKNYKLVRIHQNILVFRKE